MRRAGLIVVLMLIMVAQVAVQATPARADNPFEGMGSTHIAGILDMGDMTSLVMIRYQGVCEVPKPEPGWVPFHVVVSPRGLWAVDGYATIDEIEFLYRGGIRVQASNNWNWDVGSDICPHMLGGWISDDEVAITSYCCLDAIALDIHTGESREICTEPPPILQWQIDVATCPATGRAAMIEDRWEDLPEGGPHQYRIVVVGPDGFHDEVLDWLVDVPLDGLDWSDDGGLLMYTRPWTNPRTDEVHNGLYVTDGSGYGTRLVDDVYQAKFLPDGGYVYTTVGDGTTALHFVPADGGEWTVSIMGTLVDFDPYPCGSSPRRPPFGRRALR